MWRRGICCGHAENALPQRAKATIQCRLMPGDTAQHLLEELAATLADPKINITQDAPPTVSLSHRRRRSWGRKSLIAFSLVPTMATGFGEEGIGAREFDESVEFTYRSIKSMSATK